MEWGRGWSGVVYVLSDSQLEKGRKVEKLQAFPTCCIGACVWRRLVERGLRHDVELLLRDSRSVRKRRSRSVVCNGSVLEASSCRFQVIRHVVASMSAPPRALRHEEGVSKEETASCGIACPCKVGLCVGEGDSEGADGQKGDVTVTQCGSA